jgi:hypothetical protein
MAKERLRSPYREARFGFVAEPRFGRRDGRTVRARDGQVIAHTRNGARDVDVGTMGRHLSPVGKAIRDEKSDQKREPATSVAISRSVSPSCPFCPLSAPNAKSTFCWVFARLGIWLTRFMSRSMCRPWGFGTCFGKIIVANSSYDRER